MSNRMAERVNGEMKTGYDRHMRHIKPACSSMGFIPASLISEDERERCNKNRRLIQVLLL